LAQGSAMFGKLRGNSEVAAQKDEWDPVLVPLIKLLTGKKGLRTKSAAEVGKKKVTYFRARDMGWITAHDALMRKKCHKLLAEHFGDKDHVLTEKDFEKLITLLVQKGFVYTVQYAPLPGEDPNKKPKRWPDRVKRVEPKDSMSYDETFFYVIQYEGNTTLQHMMLGVVILMVLAGCMFPAWPLWAKFGMWYLASGLLGLLLFITVFRVIVAIIFWVVGFDFWIFPNFFDEYAGIIDSFLPFYSFERREDQFKELLVRAFFGIVIACAAHEISLEHSFEDFVDFSKTAMLDFVAWGEEKLVALPPASTVPSLEQLEAELAEVEAEEDAETDAPRATADAGADDEDAEDGVEDDDAEEGADQGHPEA